MSGKTGRIKIKKRSGFDFSLLFIMIFLLCFGFVMIYSTTSYSAQASGYESAYYLKKQVVAAVIGIVLMTVITRMDYRLLNSKAASWALYGAALLLVFLVLSPFGREYNGARRWLSLGGFSFQPAEVVKIAVIVLTAHLCSKHIRYLNRTGNVVRVFCAGLIAGGLVTVITNNLSTGIIIIGISFIMLFIADPNWKEFIIAGVAAAGAVTLYLVLGDGFRSERLLAWLHPEDYSSDTAYQVLQGLYAIGSGGFFGKGLGESVQKLGSVPEAENDMIFTIICEELGIICGIAVILMFGFMIWRICLVAKRAPDVFGTMLSVGVAAHIALQVLINIAVVTNSIPNTGATLPFISYGGSSVMILLAEMGLVFSVSRSASPD